MIGAITALNHSTALSREGSTNYQILQRTKKYLQSPVLFLFLHCLPLPYAVQVLFLLHQKLDLLLNVVIRILFISTFSISNTFSSPPYCVHFLFTHSVNILYVQLMPSFIKDQADIGAALPL